jgi:hypothetical protein
LIQFERRLIDVIEDVGTKTLKHLYGFGEAGSTRSVSARLACVSLRRRSGPHGAPPAGWTSAVFAAVGHLLPLKSQQSVIAPITTLNEKIFIYSIK